MMPPRQIARFYRQMYATANAGVPTSAALSALTSQTRPGRFQKYLQEITQQVWQGAALSVALRRYPKDFSPFHCTIILQGETTGGLAESYKSLAEIAERQALLQDQIKRELLSPKLTLLGCVPFLLILLPSPGTLDVAGIITLCLLGLFGIVLLAQYQLPRLNGHGPVALEAIIAKVPQMGKVASLIAHAQLARSLAAAYVAGMAMSHALHLAAISCGSGILRRRVLLAVPHLERGSSLYEALLITGVFPGDVLALLQTGAFTGNIDALMNCIADYYEQETALRLHRMSIMLGVIALLIVGILVGLICFKFYAR